jgi:inorganic triphosphatase YgiF
MARNVAAELVHASLRDGLLTSADVARAYALAQEISDDVNAKLNALADRREASVATSLLARALTARALLLVAGDWWASMGSGPRPAYHAALRSFVDHAPPGWEDRSGIEGE